MSKTVGIFDMMRAMFEWGLQGCGDRGFSVRNWMLRPFDDAEVNSRMRKVFNWRMNAYKPSQHYWAMMQLRWRKFLDRCEIRSLDEVATLIQCAPIYEQLSVICDDDVAFLTAGGGKLGNALKQVRENWVLSQNPTLMPTNSSLGDPLKGVIGTVTVLEYLISR